MELLLEEKVEGIVSDQNVTLCDPMDCSPPGSSVHEIFQARILEWVAISFSTDRTWVSCIGRWILYHCSTWETQKTPHTPAIVPLPNTVFGT